MTADSPDGFEYEPSSKHSSPKSREHYWAVAIGLQQVDGLEVSPFLRDVADAHIRGNHDLAEVGSLIRAHHENGEHEAFREADHVSHRIAEILSSKAFFLSPDFLIHIHRHLFQDLDTSVYHPGEFKTERMVKQEEILNGDSVLYADPSTYEMALHGAFEREHTKDYGAFDDENFKDFCQAMAFLWQIHPFYEGNTRTIAVFSELYLNYLGFDVSNEPFEKHARYYRDALVRSMYRNAAAKTFPTLEFLMSFYGNAIGLRNDPLDREALICSALFDNPELLRNVSPLEALHKKDQQK